jgi:hypothetical protein
LVKKQYHFCRTIEKTFFPEEFLPASYREESKGELGAREEGLIKAGIIKRANNDIMESAPHYLLSLS